MKSIGALYEMREMLNDAYQILGDVESQGLVMPEPQIPWH